MKNPYFGYGEQPRNIETYSRKFTNQSYNNYEVETNSRKPNFYINYEVWEEIKKGIKEIQRLLGKMSQKMDQFSEQWQELKREINQEINQENHVELARVKEDQEFNQGGGILKETQKKNLAEKGGKPKRNLEPTRGPIEKEEKMS